MVAVLPEIMKKIDEQAIFECNISSKQLMFNAAKQIYEILKKCLDKNSKICILCGKGNNGGDGYALSNLLINDKYQVFCIDIFDEFPKSDEGKEFANEFLKNGGGVFSPKSKIIEILECDFIIDCIFGTGFSKSIDEQSELFSILSEINLKSTALKIAIDCPSGINSSDGKVDTIAFCADITITLAKPKPGLYSYPAKEFCGETIVADIGIPEKIVEKFEHNIYITDDDYIYSKLPTRQNNSHKGTFGTLLAFCGSVNMTGAPTLAALSALRTGVGIYIQAGDIDTVRILQTRLTEPVFLPLNMSDDDSIDILLEKSKKSTAFLIGCGIDKSWRLSAIVAKFLRESETQIILDADGINVLSGNINVLKEAKKTPILTPHPLEFSRLCGFSVEEIQKDRLNLARNFAVKYGVILVLKGAGTIIAAPNGNTFINPTGNSALAKGGSGDVLAGVIASFCAQGIPPLEAAVCGVYLHGKAGDILRDKISTYGVLASDLPLEIAKLLP